MAIIRRTSSSGRKVNNASASSSIIRKKDDASNIVTSAGGGGVQPKTLRELNDVNFGILDNSKDGFIVSYNTDNDKLELISPDNLLDESAADDDLPDAFVTRLAIEANIQTSSVDGGTFE